jgi:hypothetical protein
LSGTRHCGATSAWLQLSTVQGLPSSQLVGAWEQSPVAGLQKSSVQISPSSQLIWTLLQMPVVVSQASVVHGLPSSQVAGTHGVPEPVAMRIVPVVLPDMPPRWPPGFPMKSMR